jgi:hypothetical protein
MESWLIHQAPDHVVKRVRRTISALWIFVNRDRPGGSTGLIESVPKAGYQSTLAVAFFPASDATGAQNAAGVVTDRVFASAETQ